MRREVLRILIIAEDPADFALIRDLLVQSRPNAAHHIDGCYSLREAKHHLTQTQYDLLLISEIVRGTTGPEILARLRTTHKMAPAVLLADHWNERTMRQAFSAGATDYLHKRTLTFAKLWSAIRAGVSLPYKENRSREAEEQLRKLSRAVEQSGDLVIITDRDGVIEYVNPAFRALTGYSSQEVLGRKPNLLKSGLQDHAYYKKLWETVLSGNVFRGVLANKKRMAS
jgi:PAS domain-containing protein